MHGTRADAPSGPVESKVTGTRANCWGQAERVGQQFPKLTQAIDACDVAIIGGGLAGLCTAYRLAKAGKNVVVLESRACGAGHTSKGHGMASRWNDDLYTSIQSIAGSERTKLAVQSQEEAIAWLEATVKREGIDCGWQRVPGLLIEHERSQQATSALYKELDTCKAAGMSDVELVELRGPPQVPRSEGGSTRKALRFEGNANADPVALTLGMADACKRAGVQIFEQSRAKAGIVTGPSHGVVQVLGGPSVTAREGVVLATRSPINRDQVWVHDRQLPLRTYSITLEVPRGSVENAQYFDTAPAGKAPLHTARLVPGRRHDLLLVSGESHHHGSARQHGDPYARLESWARERWPTAGQVVHQWSSMDYHPADLLGLYGQDPIDFSKPPVYILTGHSGQDLTGCAIGSAVVADAILGTSNMYAQLYNPGRTMPKATLNYIQELATYFSSVGAGILRHLPYNFSDLRGLLYPSAVEKSLAPGEGTVAQHGLRKKALYKREDGSLHQMSAVCTHLGCQVQFNPIDKCFDCPCHGSQYDAEGRCFNGPAVGDLEDLGGGRHSP